MNSRVIASPIGKLLLSAEAGCLCEIRLLHEGEAERPDGADPILDEAQRQLGEYFAGGREAFSLPLRLCGSSFDMAVWRQLTEIPFGEIKSYGRLAAAMGKPKASRAVGGACSRNPLLIVVPCHRVVAGTGKLTGFAAGMQAKRSLLGLEGWQIHTDRIQIE